MNDAYACAVRLLARREHSVAELNDKLLHKGYCDLDIENAINRCLQQGLQSDARFAESLVRTRIRQGYGPLRIRQELQMKHISPALITEVLSAEHENWLMHAMVVWEKKYKASGDVSFENKQKQKQFLLYRGFTPDIIAELL